MLRRNGVADSRQHIGNRISHVLTPSNFEFRNANFELENRLQIRNSKSAISLPTRLNHARDLPLERQLTKTDAAQVEFPQVTSRPAAAFASCIGAHRKLRFTCS